MATRPDQRTIPDMPSTGPAVPDLTDPATRTRLAPAAAHACTRLQDAWHLDPATMAATLGLTPAEYRRWQEHPDTDPGTDVLTIVSALLGSYQALHIAHSPELADAWMTLPNSGPACNGARPIDAIATGGPSTAVTIRRHLDAITH